MPRRARLSPDETRDRIIDAAEDLFRRVGYVKTTVADIAAEIGMSPANVYRFFPSKAAINEALCEALLSDQLERARDVVNGPGTPSERLSTLLLELHRYHRDQFIHEKRVHDMVEAAMAESWGTIEAHIGRVVELKARLIAEGIAAGEFAPCDPAATAYVLNKCAVSVLHPRLIAECADEDLEAQTRDIARFVLQALRVGAAP